MDKVKRFAKYVIWIILFWILSDILINVGIDSTYKDMKNRGELPKGIEVVQMQSTKVNGKIKLKLSNEELSGKYLKIDLYSNIGNVLGTQYIEVGTINTNQVKEVETYFKITDIKSYEISIVDEAGETTEGFLDTALGILSVYFTVISLLFVI